MDTLKRVKIFLPEPPQVRLNALKVLELKSLLLVELPLHM